MPTDVRTKVTLTGTATSTDALRISDITFDECGNRLTSRDSRGVSRYEYDVLGRLTKVTDPNGRWVAYVYDLNGNKTTMTVYSDDPEFEHVTAYAYNDSGLLSQVTGPNNEVITYTYWDNGALKKMDYPNGIHADYAYNSRDWVTSLVHMKADDTVVAGFSYSYDPNTWGNNGTPTGMAEDLLGPSGTISGVVSYAYDDQYRLIGETRTGSYAYNKAYAYDGNGNRLAKVDNGTTYYHYNSADKLLDYGASNTSPYTGNTPLTYDDAGNLITEGGQAKTYTYTIDSLLASVTRQGVSNPSVLAWDRDANRVSFTSSTGGTWQYVYDVTASIPAVLEEITSAGPVSYLRDPDGTLIASITGTGEAQSVQYYHMDALGSEKVLTDASSSAADAYAYDAWGNLLGHDGSTQQPYQYVGQLGYYNHSQDPDLPLLQLGVRFYDPHGGRFTQVDSVVSRSVSAYVYAVDNPVSSADPAGTFPTYDMGPSCKKIFGGGGAGDMKRWAEGHLPDVNTQYPGSNLAGCKKKIRVNCQKGRLGTTENGSSICGNSALLSNQIKVAYDPKHCDYPSCTMLHETIHQCQGGGPLRIGGSSAYWDPINIPGCKCDVAGQHKSP